MATTTDNNLRFELPDVGADSNTWGTILNALFTELERSITAIHSFTITGGTLDLTADGATDEPSRKAVLKASGTLSSNATVRVPNEPKLYVISNLTSGAFSLTLNTVVPGSGLVIPQGETHLVYIDPSLSGGNGGVVQLSALPSGTIAQATNALQLGGVVAASYAQLALKQSWTRPQTLTPENVTLTAGAYTPNADTQSHIRVQQSQVTGNVTINNPSGTPVDGQILTVEIEQHGVTVRSVIWGGNYIFEGGSDLDLTQTVDRIDKFTFQYSGSVARWLLVGAIQNIPRV